MDPKFTTYLRALKLSSGIALFGLIGCAHQLGPVQISPIANAVSELQSQSALMVQAQESQVDVMAAAPFHKAHEYLKDAEKYNNKGEGSEKVFEALGYSKAYLNKAVEDAQFVKPYVTVVAEARIDALKAGGRNYPKDLNPIDKKFTDMTDHPGDSQKIASEDKTKLQTQYLLLELTSIKRAQLHVAKNSLNLANKKGAEKITPVAYKEAVEKIFLAEKIIDTDRHNAVLIAPAVAQANTSSQRVLTLLASEQNSRSQSPEQRAMTLEARDLAVTEANVATSEVLAESSIKDVKIAQKDEKLAIANVDLATTEGANRELLRREQDEKVVTDAAAQFDKSEADVYRQDGNLVIRLKTMNFATNRADLPAESIVVLNKVKTIMKEIAPISVMVEGHTDAVGDAKRNKSLSLKRAQSVVKFFSGENLYEGNIMDSMGLGYSKPLASNKTKAGRAQNRRVDIVIKTARSTTL